MRELAAEGAGGGSVAMVVTRGRRGGREGGRRERGRRQQRLPFGFFVCSGFFPFPGPGENVLSPGSLFPRRRRADCFSFSARSARPAVCFSLFLFLFFPFLSFRFFFPLSFIFLGICPFSLSARCFIRLLTAKQLGPPPWVHPPLLASDYIYICIWFVWRIVAIFPTKKKIWKKIMLQIPSLFSGKKKNHPIFYFIFKSPQSLAI